MAQFLQRFNLSECTAFIPILIFLLHFFYCYNLLIWADCLKDCPESSITKHLSDFIFFHLFCSYIIITIIFIEKDWNVVNHQFIYKYKYHYILKIDSAPFSPPATKCRPIGSTAHIGLPDWKLSTQLFILRSQIFILLSKEQEKAILLSVGWALTQETAYLWSS